ncbi:polyketide synthase [Aspergillus affinis]|uniref:polyketide synthase n=1 Tax=Aspergillus affinis TaxID=1070780 RepID=UPI0022FDB694|nr:polyketide synthase [Aspergillus affinis]KAI9046259.1 polyketide synthase [Aspergillus affinis]
MCHTRFFEAHGTGTLIGDPIEVGTIFDCFQGHRTALSPLYVGSVKTNIGHLEGASGIAGVIKSVIVVESSVIPPNANFERLNPRLAAYSCIEFPQRCVAWPEGDIRRVPINSFGYGGSNCHIVLDDAYSYLRRHGLSGNHRTAVVPSEALENSFLTAPHLNSGFTAPHQSLGLSNTPKLLVWSANSEASLKEILVRWQEYFRRACQHKDPTWLSNVTYILDSPRSIMAWKAYAVVESASELVDVQQIAPKPQTQSTPSQAPRLAFAFTGQGAQWYGMGRELLAYERFSRVVDEAEALYRELGCSWSVREEMLKDENESSIDAADISQSLTAILQIGIVDLLESFNVVPCLLSGIRWARLLPRKYAAGILTRQSALLLAYYRGTCVMRLSKENARRGAMLAVGLSADEIKPYPGRLHSQSKCSIVVACVNSPHNVTVSGPESEVQILHQVLLCDNVFVHRLRARVAYHSLEMRYIANDCLRLFSGLKSPAMTEDSIPMVSSSLNCEGVIEAHHSTGESINPTLSQCQRGYWDARDGACGYKMSAPDVYRTFKDNGFYYGPSCQGIQDTYHDSASHATTAICLDRPLCLDPVHLDYVIHPATLDAMFQLTLVTLMSDGACSDIMYENMTLEDWHLAIDPKVTGSWNLHSVLPRDMDFFILTSSITGILGQATQINYAAASTYQDSLAHYRLSQGEHAISIDLGILLTGGLLSQRQGLVDRLVSTNLYEPISEAEILALFDYICDPALSGRLSPQIITGIVRPSRAADRAPSPAFLHPTWSLSLALSAPETSNIERSAEEADTQASLSQAGSVAEAAEIIVHTVAGRFCRTSLTPKEKLDLDVPLHVAGADSLTAVDLRNWILKEFAVDVPVFDILGDSSVHELGLTIALEWKKRLQSSAA